MGGSFSIAHCPLRSKKPSRPKVGTNRPRPMARVSRAWAPPSRSRGARTPVGLWGVGFWTSARLCLPTPDRGRSTRGPGSRWSALSADDAEKVLCESAARSPEGAGKGPGLKKHLLGPCRLPPKANWRGAGVQGGLEGLGPADFAGRPRGRGARVSGTTQPPMETWHRDWLKGIIPPCTNGTGSYNFSCRWRRPSPMTRRRYILTDSGPTTHRPTTGNSCRPTTTEWVAPTRRQWRYRSRHERGRAARALGARPSLPPGGPSSPPRTAASQPPATY